MKIVKVGLSIFATFRHGGELGYCNSFDTFEIDLDSKTDSGGRIGLHLAAFLEREIDHARELDSLSHSIILVPT